MFDPMATLNAVAKEISELDARHRAAPTKAGKPRAPIDWPRLPQPLDWSAAPAPPRGVTDDPLASETIGVARWVADLADAWSNVETLRLSREHLRDDEISPRPLPVVVLADAVE
jgi:hypothetical protein